MKSLFSGSSSQPKKSSTPKASPTRALVVERVERETADATTLVLTDPTGAPVAFEAGQFFTLLRKVDGKELRRAYSACSSADDASRVAVTVKRVPGGAVSPGLVDDVRPGETLEVSGPAGQFTLADGIRKAIFIGGGSGITPLMSLARTHLARRPELEIALIYGSRSVDDIIFKDALSALVEKYEGRFTVTHVLEAAHESAAHVGRLDAENLKTILQAEPLYAEGVFMICGPTGMMDQARSGLVAMGVDEARIKEERFVSPTDAASQGSDAVQTVEVRVMGEVHEVSVQPGLTILEAAQEQGVEIPFSCTVGGCASCRVRLKSGKVSLGEPNCLDPKERKEGYILACVSKPLGPCSIEVE